MTSSSDLANYSSDKEVLGVNPGAFINGLTVLTRLRELVLAEFKALLFGVINVVMTAIGVRISAK